MTTNSRRIATATAQPGYRLAITWQDGATAIIDMTGVVHKNPFFASLKDEAAFAAVSVIDYGTGIEWDNGIDYSADSLEMLAQDQVAMTPSGFQSWKTDMRLSTNEMADIFGISASAVKSYLSGASAIPIAVQIACQAMRDKPAILWARFRPRIAGRPRKNTAAA